MPTATAQRPAAQPRARVGLDGISPDRHRAGPGRGRDGKPRRACSSTAAARAPLPSTSAGRCRAPASSPDRAGSSPDGDSRRSPGCPRRRRSRWRRSPSSRGSLAGGAVTLAVMSQRLFGAPVERRQWLALFLGGAGLALLAVTVPQFSGSHSAVRVGADPRLRGRPGADRRRRWRSGTAPSASIPTAASCWPILAGTLFALAGVAIKGLTGAGQARSPRSSPAGSRSSSSAASSPSTRRSRPFSAAARSRRSA